MMDYMAAMAAPMAMAAMAAPQVAAALQDEDRMNWSVYDILRSFLNEEGKVVAADLEDVLSALPNMKDIGKQQGGEGPWKVDPRSEHNSSTHIYDANPIQLPGSHKRYTVYTPVSGKGSVVLREEGKPVPDEVSPLPALGILKKVVAGGKGNHKSLLTIIAQLLLGAGIGATYAGNKITTFHVRNKSAATSFQQVLESEVPLLTETQVNKVRAALLVAHPADPAAAAGGAGAPEGALPPPVCVLDLLIYIGGEIVPVGDAAKSFFLELLAEVKKAVAHFACVWPPLSTHARPLCSFSLAGCACARGHRAAGEGEDPWRGKTCERVYPLAATVVARHVPEAAEFLASTASAVGKLALVLAFKRRLLVAMCLLAGRDKDSSAAPVRLVVADGVVGGNPVTFHGCTFASVFFLPVGRWVSIEADQADS